MSRSSNASDPPALLAAVRSLLFVPGDRPDRMEKALALPEDARADALILDLEDSVAPAAKATARAAVAARLASSRAGSGHRPIPLIVRINPVESAYVADDLAAILPAGPDAIMLPKADSAATLAALAAMASALPPVLPLTCETAAGVLGIGSLPTVANRLCGLTWGAEDLATEIGARDNRAEGGFSAPFRFARNLALFTAHAARIPAIETVYPDIRDEAGLSQQATRAARDGFSAMLAIHPAQIPVINRAFTPNAQQIAEAHTIVEAFRAAPQAGVLQVNGKMIDAPHLKRAQALLGRGRRHPDGASFRSDDMSIPVARGDPHFPSRFQ